MVGESSEYRNVEDQFQCKVCEVNRLSKRLLMKHNKENHLKYLACEHCGKMFREVWMLEVHLKLHNNVKTIKCNFCSKLFV